MVVTQAYPRDLWDPTTRFLQPQVDFRQRLGTLEARKLGALLIRLEKFDSFVDGIEITYCVLIFGITCSGFVPWCHLSPTRGFNEESYTQMSLGPREQADYFQQPRIDTYLQREFDNFPVDPLSIPIDIEAARRHVYICDALQLVTVAESRIVSGKEVYLLHLLTISKYLDGTSS
jgi:hypothetical protein